MDELIPSLHRRRQGRAQVSRSSRPLAGLVGGLLLIALSTSIGPACVGAASQPPARKPEPGDKDSVYIARTVRPDGRVTDPRAFRICDVRFDRCKDSEDSHECSARHDLQKHFPADASADPTPWLDGADASTCKNTIHAPPGKRDNEEWFQLNVCPGAEANLFTLSLQICGASPVEDAGTSESTANPQADAICGAAEARGDGSKCQWRTGMMALCRKTIQQQHDPLELQFTTAIAAPDAIRDADAGRHQEDWRLIVYKATVPKPGLDGWAPTNLASSLEAMCNEKPYVNAGRDAGAPVSVEVWGAVRFRWLPAPNGSSSAAAANSAPIASSVPTASPVPNPRKK